MTKFKVGDRVRYISGIHGSHSNNPLYKDFGIVGTVVVSKDKLSFPLNVLWDNKCSNDYNHSDLEYDIKNLFNEDFVL